MAFTIASGVAGPANTGRPRQGHVCYASNQGAWWAFFLTSTQSLSAAYSTDGGASWSAPVGSPVALANPHGSDGRNFGFNYMNLSGFDVLHMASAYSGIGGDYHARFTLGATWTNTHAEAPKSGTTGIARSGIVTATVSGDVPVDGGPNWNYGNAGVVIALNADTGASWTPGFGPPHMAAPGPNGVTSAALFDVGGGGLLTVTDNDFNAIDSSNNLNWNQWNGSGFGTAANVFGSNWTQVDNGQCWGACLRTTSDVHVLAAIDGTGTFGHVRWDGTAWSNSGGAPPNLTIAASGVGTSGVALVSDGTAVWAAVIDTGGNVRAIKWTAGTGWDASWTTLESGRTAAGYLTGAYDGTGHILWAWTEGSGTSNVVGTLMSTGGGGSTFTVTVSGGVALGGLFAPSAAFAPAATGGAIAGGSFAPSIRFAAPCSGGPIAGGSFAPSNSFAAPCSGGVVLGGLAAPSATFAAGPSGGAALGGLAAPSASFAAAASGGAVLSGPAAPTVVFVATPAGGVLVGGTAQGQSGGVTAQTFRQALVAKLESIPELSAIVGESIFPGALPEAHDLDRDGPALTYTIPTNPRGHHLGGSDGTSTARVQLSAWGYDLADTDSITRALFDAMDGLVNDGSWGNGTVTIVSCLQDDETDLPEPVGIGSDEWSRQIASFYAIKHRVSLPTHT